MPRIFSFTDRTTASNGPPSLLADGAFYDRHKSRFDLSGAENVRFNVLLGRLGKAKELEDPELARDCLEKLTMLVFQRVSCPPVKPLDNEALYAHLERFFKSDRESQEERPQSRDRAEEPDIGLAVCQYADRYKQDPFYVWEQVPLWMLDAGLRCDEVTSTARISAPVPGSADGHGELQEQGSDALCGAGMAETGYGKAAGPTDCQGLPGAGIRHGDSCESDCDNRP